MHRFRLEHDEMFKIIEPDEGKSLDCSFGPRRTARMVCGIRQAREKYIEKADQLPMTAVSVGGEIIGFLSVE